MTTIDTVTEIQIRILRDEAEVAWDSEQVQICNGALQQLACPDLGSAYIAECVRVIRNAEAQS